MSQQKIENIQWLRDAAATQKGEAGFSHSYISSLATILNSLGEEVDFTWLNGTSAFAFRTFVHEALCPSAMSVFDWTSLLPEAVEQAGFECRYVSRLWHEEAQTAERQAEAHDAIRDAINRGVPALVWDIGVPEWGVITGYDDDSQTYDTLACTGQVGKLAYEQLGQREIPILSVAIPAQRNRRTHEEIVLNSLQAVVRHADQQEWMDRPVYQDGPAAFEHWARAIEPGGPAETNWEFAPYYADHYYSARCYARDYLASIADDNAMLLCASKAYGRVADHLKPVWQEFHAAPHPDDAALVLLAGNLRAAQREEETAISQIRQYVASVASGVVG